VIVTVKLPLLPASAPIPESMRPSPASGSTPSGAFHAGYDRRRNSTTAVDALARLYAARLLEQPPSTLSPTHDLDEPVL
jgi:hypothetical protein